jgi:hypothetical protein
MTKNAIFLLSGDHDAFSLHLPLVRSGAASVPSASMSQRSDGHELWWLSTSKTIFRPSGENQASLSALPVLPYSLR